ncbi:hypothetical protein [Afifella aestuarii]|uniref:AbiU2 domain-containing protein n=1 Tax=Afifella aestuarii TaxID=1909496 RepID=UPI000FE2FE4F|nr:hypothetical protein [Afifella aestuarii]
MDSEAKLRLVEQITEDLREEVSRAISSYAVMEGGNEVFPKLTRNVRHKSISVYNTIKFSMILKISMDIARIYDRDNDKRKNNDNSKSSIFTLEKLFKEEEIKKAVVCRDKLEKYLNNLESYKKEKSEEYCRINKIRKFRNSYIAHRLNNNSNDDIIPTFGDIEILLKDSILLVSCASLAVEGRNTEFCDKMNRERELAREYYRVLAKGFEGEGIEVS